MIRSFLKRQKTSCIQREIPIVSLLLIPVINFDRSNIVRKRTGKIRKRFDPFFRVFYYSARFI